MTPIRFNQFKSSGREAEYLASALQSGAIGGGGRFATQCEEFLERRLGVTRTLLTTSCTHALEMSALLLKIKPGDRVILPTFTFVSTANAFVLQGAQPIFADIRPDTLNLDETRLEQLVTAHTPKAIVLLHYGGVGCEMDTIMRIATEHGIPIVEDHAHGPFATYREKMLGSFGSFATLSFHETKNISCGEGGALLINNPEFIDRAEIIRDKGTDRHHFLRGHVDKYTWVDVGSSYQISDLLAAALAAQLEASDSIQDLRRSQWEFYLAELHTWAAEQGIGLPTPPAHCQHSHHVFYLILPTREDRSQFIDHMRRRSIACPFHYVPLHLSRLGKDLGGKSGDCPVAERISECLVRLPLHGRLGSAELERIVEAVKSFSCCAGTTA